VFDHAVALIKALHGCASLDCWQRGFGKRQSSGLVQAGGVGYADKSQGERVVPCSLVVDPRFEVWLKVLIQLRRAISELVVARLAKGRASAQAKALAPASASRALGGMG